MKKWRYKIEVDLDTEALDKLGKKGWELISVVHTSWVNERKGWTETQDTFYFKR